MSSTRLKRRTDGRYCVKIRYTDSEGHQHQSFVYDENEQACKDKAAEARRRLKEGQPARDSRDHLSGFTRTWIDSTLELNRKLKRSTKDWYARLARCHIIDNPIGDLRLDKLNVTQIETWILGLQQQGLSQSTIRGSFTTLSKILASAVTKEKIRKNWCKDMERPTVTKKEATHLDAKQVTALLDAAQETRYGLLFKLLILTGLRRGEALALTWGDVRPGRADILHCHGTLARIDGKLTVTEPKTSHATRDLYISDELDAVLRELKQRQRVERLKAGSLWEQTGFIFTTELGQPCDPRNALRAFKVAAEKAGLDNVGLHTLRHSAATIMLSAGVPIVTVSRQLGHSSVSITGDIYGHVGEEASAQAMNALAKAVHG